MRRYVDNAVGTGLEGRAKRRNGSILYWYWPGNCDRGASAETRNRLIDRSNQLNGEGRPSDPGLPHPYRSCLSIKRLINFRVIPGPDIPTGGGCSQNVFVFVLTYLSRHSRPPWLSADLYTYTYTRTHTPTQANKHNIPTCVLMCIIYTHTCECACVWVCVCMRARFTGKVK